MKVNLHKIFSSDELQGNASHISQFFIQYKKGLEIKPKNRFFFGCKRVFYALLRPTIYTQILMPIARSHRDT